MPVADDGKERGAGRAVLVYNLYRLGLLAVFLGIGALLGLPMILVIVAALLVSGVLSWFLLRRQREAMALAVERTVARGQRRMAERTAREDEYVDRLYPTSAAADADDSTPARGDLTTS
jgi:Protein of unknown function (DUF4229)